MLHANLMNLFDWLGFLIAIPEKPKTPEQRWRQLALAFVFIGLVVAACLGVAMWPR